MISRNGDVAEIVTSRGATPWDDTVVDPALLPIVASILEEGSLSLK